MDEPETKRANADLVEQITDEDIEPDRIEVFLGYMYFVAD